MNVQVPVGQPRIIVELLGFRGPDSGLEGESGSRRDRHYGPAHEQILLVEDDRSIRDVLRGILEEHGYVVTTADWVVGGSLLMPAGKRSVTITARVTDNANRTRSVSHVVGISPVENGQNLTPAP